MFARSCSSTLGKRTCTLRSRESSMSTCLQSERGGKCARLLFTLYGLRTAPSSWEKEYTKTMEEAGFVTGLATACAFFHKEKNIRVVVHGDDVIIEGAECDLRWVEATYIVKMRAMLGPERTDDKVADILNRVVEWKDEELWCEADPRHVEKMLNDMELGECKESVAPGTKTTEQEDDNEQLDVESAKRYRSVVARGNFLAQDRPERCRAEEVVQILERHAESRAEGQDRSRLGQRRGLRLGRAHKDLEEYKRRVHSA